MHLSWRSLASTAAVLTAVCGQTAQAEERPAAVRVLTSADYSASAAIPMTSATASDTHAAPRTGLRIGHDTVEGAPRYAVRSESENGVATVRFSATRPRAQVAGAISSLGSLPVSGARLTSAYGYRINPVTQREAFHHGVDLAAASGTPVYATGSGRVVFSGRSGGYGLLVVIDHGNGVTTRMGHLSALLVAQGEEVEAGEAVGRVGATGRATGPHVHYEIRVDGGSVDPLPVAS